MALCKRLIARLDIKGNRLIKGIRFEGLRVLGDPCEAALRYYKEGADELIYIDAVASLYGRNGLDEVLRRTSREVFVPITAGGGVRSVADAAALLAAGADKIAVNTAALQRPELITELAEAFGSQCVVSSIQARRIGPGQWEAMAEAGRERSGRDVFDWIEQVQQLGAGEILLTSVDQDGTCKGPDEQLVDSAARLARVSLVVGGGFAHTHQLVAALQHSEVSGVSLAAALHYNRLEVYQLKYQLLTSAKQPLIRHSPTVYESEELRKLLCGLSIGVIDYGIGNQQSLINALRYLGANVILSDQPQEHNGQDILALPGVGSFPMGMAELRRRGLDKFLKKWVSGGKPLVGICLGMQMLFEESHEYGITPGLALLKGSVSAMSKYDTDGNSLILPHIGWNSLLRGPGCNTKMPANQLIQYFVHSYCVTNVDPGSLLYTCEYGQNSFVAAVSQDSVAGFQFHPERSGKAGLELLAIVCCELVRRVS